MRGERYAGWVILAALVAVVCWATVKGSDVAQAEKRPTEKGQPKHKVDPAIADTKKKGFEGVDFSYDSFGAPPGQDAYKTADEVTAKDTA